jgi:hypothetical protein
MLNKSPVRQNCRSRLNADLTKIEQKSMRLRIFVAATFFAFVPVSSASAQGTDNSDVKAGIIGCLGSAVVGFCLGGPAGAVGGCLVGFVGGDLTNYAQRKLVHGDSPANKIARTGISVLGGAATGGASGAVSGGVTQAAQETGSASTSSASTSAPSDTSSSAPPTDLPPTTSVRQDPGGSTTTVTKDGIPVQTIWETPEGNVVTFYNPVGIPVETLLQPQDSSLPPRYLPTRGPASSGQPGVKSTATPEPCKPNGAASQDRAFRSTPPKTGATTSSSSSGIILRQRNVGLPSSQTSQVGTSPIVATAGTAPAGSAAPLSASRGIILRPTNNVPPTQSGPQHAPSQYVNHGPTGSVPSQSTGAATLAPVHPIGPAGAQPSIAVAPAPSTTHTPTTAPNTFSTTGTKQHTASLPTSTRTSRTRTSRTRTSRTRTSRTAQTTRQVYHSPRAVNLPRRPATAVRRN